MNYIVLCYQGNEPAQPYFELVSGGLKKYTFCLTEAQDIANDLSMQYGVFGDIYKIAKLENTK